MERAAGKRFALAQMRDYTCCGDSGVTQMAGADGHLQRTCRISDVDDSATSDVPLERTAGVQLDFGPS